MMTITDGKLNDINNFNKAILPRSQTAIRETQIPNATPCIMPNSADSQRMDIAVQITPIPNTRPWNGPSPADSQKADPIWVNLDALVLFTGTVHMCCSNSCSTTPTKNKEDVRSTTHSDQKYLRQDSVHLYSSLVLLTRAVQKSVQQLLQTLRKKTGSQTIHNIGYPIQGSWEK